MSDCIEWRLGRDSGGYGKLWDQGKARRIHQVEWERWHGQVPPGLVVRHTCDNPPCHNIDHLVLGTKRQNSQDMAQRGRARNQNKERKTCIRGHLLSGDNLYTQPDGKRQCRACKHQRYLLARER
jgi:hypothetical protein